MFLLLSFVTILIDNTLFHLYRIDVNNLLNKFCDYNLHILGAKAFYPLHWKERDCLYQSTKTKGGKLSPCLLDEVIKNGTMFAVHTWFNLFRRMGQKSDDIPAASPYMRLAKMHCPITYHTHMENLQ